MLAKGLLCFYSEEHNRRETSFKPCNWTFRTTVLPLYLYIVKKYFCTESFFCLQAAQGHQHKQKQHTRWVRCFMAHSYLFCVSRQRCPILYKIRRVWLQVFVPVNQELQTSVASYFLDWKPKVEVCGMMCGIFCTNSKTIIATIIMVERNSGSAIQSQELGTTGLEMHISTMDSSLEFRLSISLFCENWNLCLISEWKWHEYKMA